MNNSCEELAATNCLVENLFHLILIFSAVTREIIYISAGMTMKELCQFVSNALILLYKKAYDE